VWLHNTGYWFSIFVSRNRISKRIISLTLESSGGSYREMKEQPLSIRWFRQMIGLPIWIQILCGKRWLKILGSV
jgi:hypothetical protein